MTRKHYEILVNVINSAVSQNISNWSDKEQRAVFSFINDCLLKDLFIELEIDNKNFDSEKFTAKLEYDFS